MVDFFCRLLISVKDKNRYLKRLRWYSFQRLVIRTIANLCLPVYFRLTAHKEQNQLKPSSKQGPKLIVSLTSFPERINTVWMVIETILRQTILPDKIILWLSQEQFSTLQTLPESLLRLQKRGLQIELKKEDLKSHKKYYYALKEFPDDLLVTIDDDIFYPADTIETLIDGHKKHPDCVIARYAHEIKIENNEVAPYNCWGKVSLINRPSDTIFFGSGGGTLFPAKILHEDTLCKDIFMNICKYADDVWLNLMLRLNRHKVVKTDCANCFLTIQNKSPKSLYKKNINENLNDKQIAAVRTYCIQYKGKDPLSIIIEKYPADTHPYFNYEQ